MKVAAKSLSGKGSAAEGDAATLARELADVKKRFLAVAKKKQAEYAKRVRPTALCARVHLRKCLRWQITGIAKEAADRRWCGSGWADLWLIGVCVLMLQVKELEDAVAAAEVEKTALAGAAAEGEAALKACMARVADLEARAADAPESLAPKVLTSIALLSMPFQ